MTTPHWVTMSRQETKERLRRSGTPIFRHPYRQRNEDILAMWLDGWSLDKISAKHGVTRERVRQILSKFKRRIYSGSLDTEEIL